MPVGQEAVFAVRLQQEISCGGQRARFREGQEVLEPEAPVNTVTSKVWETGERPEIPQKPRSGWKGRLSPACERGTHVDPPPPPESTGAPRSAAAQGPARLSSGVVGNRGQAVSRPRDGSHAPLAHPKAEISFPNCSVWPASRGSPRVRLWAHHSLLRCSPAPDSR